jgi:hypothetical protein
MKNGWTGGTYSFFRALLGLSLFVYFLRLLPWGMELFSNQGALANFQEKHGSAYFPNILALWNSPSAVMALLALGAFLGILLTIGLKDRIAAIGLWYLWACLLDRNPFILNPQFPYIGWLLLAHACLPGAPYGSWEARSRPGQGKAWEFPGPIQEAAWWVVGLTYSYSGFYKLLTPAWKDGSALFWILQNPLSRENLFCRLMLELPSPCLMGLTWMAAWLEFLYWPLALFRRTRPWIWTAMVMVHLALIFLMDFFWISWGMILVQLFLFDPAWIKGIKKKES